MKRQRFEENQAWSCQEPIILQCCPVPQLQPTRSTKRRQVLRDVGEPRPPRLKRPERFRRQLGFRYGQVLLKVASLQAENGTKSDLSSLLLIFRRHFLQAVCIFQEDGCIIVFHWPVKAFKMTSTPSRTFGPFLGRKFTVKVHVHLGTMSGSLVTGRLG